MSRLRFYPFVALLILIISSVSAWVVPEFSKLTGRVVDKENLLSPAQIKQLTAQLKAHENATTNQVARVGRNSFIIAPDVFTKSKQSFLTYLLLATNTPPTPCHRTGLFLFQQKGAVPNGTALREISCCFAINNLLDNSA